MTSPSGRPTGATIPDDRIYPACPRIAASVAVFHRGKVLVATRTKPPGDGVWSLPGGMVETGETLEQAALRELLEEVGVTAKIIAFNEHLERIDRDETGRVKIHFVLANFVGVWVSGQPRAGPEAGDVRWAEPNELATMSTTPALADIVAKAAIIYETALADGRIADQPDGTPS